MAGHYAAARRGDLAALVAMLDTEAVGHADGAAVPTGAPIERRGATAVARSAMSFAGMGRLLLPAEVDGAVGAVVALPGQPYALMRFTVRSDRVVRIDIIADADRLQELDLVLLTPVRRTQSELGR